MTPAEQGSVLLLTGQLFALAGQFWVFARQLRVFRRQADIMDRQADIMSGQRSVYADQLALAKQASQWRRDEAIGTFYRLALDIVAELKKGDDGLRTGGGLSVDYNTHPRQVLRTASATFAPLGNIAMMALNSVGLSLDEYFSAVQRYNQLGGGAIEHIAVEENRITTLRAMIGNHLDLAQKQIPADLRWNDASGEEFVFRTRCALPQAERTA